MPAEVESMAYVGATPWHRLGMKLTGEPSPQEIQRAAKLDWTVKKVPLTYSLAGLQHFSDHYALVRESDGRLLDTVSENWKPVQNDAAFAFFERFTEIGGMTMEVAGSLMGGRRVFALAKIKKSFRLARAPEDVTESYLLFTNPHQYGHSVDIRFTPVRVVCMNTLTLALGQRNSEYRVSFNHARGYDEDTAVEVLGLATDQLHAYQRQADFLASRRYTEASPEEILQGSVPSADVAAGTQGRKAEAAPQLRTGALDRRGSARPRIRAGHLVERVQRGDLSDGPSDRPRRDPPRYGFLRPRQDAQAQGSQSGAGIRQGGVNNGPGRN